MYSNKQKRILVVRTDRVGDVCFITPALRELRNSFPDAFIATLTQPHTSNLILNNPNVDAILTDDLKKDSFWNVVKDLKKHKFTHALLMLPTERAAYQLFLAGIKVRVGIGHKLYEVITFMKSVSRTNYIPLRHEADYCLDQARKIGAKVNNLLLELFVTQKEKEEAKEFLFLNNIYENDTKIFIHVGSLGSAPNWSHEKYFSFLSMLTKQLDKKDYKFVLTAREMTDEFKAKVALLNDSRIIDISLKIAELRDMIKIISLADLFFAPSTGPLHIADGLGIKCVGLHCRRPVSSAIHQGILNNVSINLEVSQENCLKYCSKDQNSCGIEKGITEEEAVNAIKKLLIIN